MSLGLSRGVKNGKECIVITVKDTGIGIQAEDIPKLFDNFQRFDEHRNRNIVGTGLGLAIVKNIVELMDGTIEVTSTYGEGSLFTVWLPSTLGDPAKISRGSDIPKVMAAPDTRVLVVDDNAINITVALNFLATHHIQADTALSGKEAINKIKSMPYDIVFMDHMMPEMDDMETAKYIRDLPGGRFKTMPIVALTANALSGSRELFLKSGINDFLAKPIEAAELNRVLSAWCPPQKLPTPAWSAKTPSDTYSPKTLLALFAIPELDVTEGLAHVGGNIPVYIDILRQFCADLENYITEIHRALASENWKDYSIHLHGMKGVFANIGAETLRAWAYKLELAGKNRESAVCQGETDAICAAMTEFRDKVQSTF